MPFTPFYDSRAFIKLIGFPISCLKCNTDKYFKGMILECIN